MSNMLKFLKGILDQINWEKAKVKFNEIWKVLCEIKINNFVLYEFKNERESEKVRE